MKTKAEIRLFVDAHVLDGVHQGTKSFIRNIYQHLSQERHLKIYMAAYDTEHLKQVFGNNKQIVYLKYKSPWSFSRLLLEIPVMLLKYGINYAHFQYVCPPVKLCRYIITTHDVIFEDLPEYYSRNYRISRKYFYKRSAQMADLITTVSEHSKNAIYKHLGVKKEIHLVPNGVNHIFMDPVDKKTARAYIYQHYGIENFILYVSRIEPRKNHQLLVNIFCQLELYKKGFTLVLLGSRTSSTPLFDKVLNGLKKEVRDNILINDHIPDEELPFFYKAASLFVYPSIGEGFGIPPLEAAAMETPVVCSNMLGLKQFDFFEQDHVDPRNEEAFCERVLKILSGDISMKQLESRSQYVQKVFSWKTAADSFQKLIINDHNLRTNDSIPGHRKQEGSVPAEVSHR